MSRSKSHIEFDTKKNWGSKKKLCLYIKEIKRENGQEYDFSLTLKIPDWIQIIWGGLKENLKAM